MTKKISEQVRDAMNGCGKSRYAVAKESGIDESVLSRFANGHTDLGLASLDKLAEAIGMRVSFEKPKKPKKGR